MSRPVRSDEQSPIVPPAAVLEFWFGAPPLAMRAEWFRKDPAFDQRIRESFGALVDRAIDHGLGWGPAPADRLAEILVLDQFPRNLFRDHARAFAGDARALAIAIAMIEAGDDRALDPVQRWFAYLPLEHAEDLALQDRCVALFEALAAEHPASANPLDYARKHRDVIRRFGRFPHRNRALGRVSTAAEAEYLRQPGSGF
jgi:uncharacterized protein (DUF924 family)